MFTTLQFIFTVSNEWPDQTMNKYGMYFDIDSKDELYSEIYSDEEKRQQLLKDMDKLDNIYYSDEYNEEEFEITSEEEEWAERYPDFDISSDEDEDEQIIFEGVDYLLDESDNTVIDAEDFEIMGKWNRETKTIEFEDDEARQKHLDRLA